MATELRVSGVALTLAANQVCSAGPWWRVVSGSAPGLLLAVVRWPLGDVASSQATTQRGICMYSVQPRHASSLTRARTHKTRQPDSRDAANRRLPFAPGRSQAHAQLHTTVVPCGAGRPDVRSETATRLVPAWEPNGRDAIHFFPRIPATQRNGDDEPKGTARRSLQGMRGSDMDASEKTKVEHK